AVLPHRYDTVTQAGVPLAIGLGLTQILFAVNIVQTLRGKRATGLERNARGVVAVAVAAGLALAGSAFGWAAGATASKAATTSAAATTPSGGGGTAAVAAGKTIFASA